MTSAIVLGGSRGIGKAISESLRSLEIDVFAASKKDIDTSNLSSVNEFLSECLRINERFRLSSICLSDRKTINMIKQLHKDKCQSMTIMPSDKTKRLIALDNECYDKMLNDCLNSEDSTVKSILTKSIQSKFNKILYTICKKYSTESSTFF